MRFRSVVTLALLLVLAACSAEGSLAQSQSAAPPATTAPSTTAPTADVTPAAEPEPTNEDVTTTVPAVPPAGAPTLGAPASDRIVVATGAGQVYLIGPDGEDRLDFTSDGLGGQPVWSPDGRRIAWSQRDGLGFSITSANADGTERRRASTLFSGYFGYWSPTSARLGFLGNAPPGTGLVIDAGTGSDLDAVIDSDTFYYFSWSPEGTRWFVHSGSGFSIVTLDGARTPIDLDNGRFRAPIWAPDGSIIVAAQLGGRNVIVELDPDSGDFEEVLEVGDITNFVLDPSGRFLAVESVVFADGEIDPGSGITVSTSLQPETSGAEVVVYDRQTRDVRQVFDERTGGFWWSPDGTTLAMLVREQGATPVFAQWLIWRADESFRTERFRITGPFATAYVPFFDQFAQSVTPWSPDSTRFVYSAFDQAGEPGVFVQRAQPESAPKRISDDAGVAFWSPT